MKRRWLQPRTFVLTVIIAAATLMGVRIEAVRDTLVAGKAFKPIDTATAEDTPAKASDLAPKPEVSKPKSETKAEPAAKASDAPKAEAKAPAPENKTTETTTAKDEAKNPAKSAPDAKAATPVIEVPLIAMPAPEEMTAGEIEVLKQLSSRRVALDQREQDVAQKSAILQAAEIRVDQKVKQMEALRNQLQGMLTQLDEQQQAQIANLVKIYETMKPKDAARILQTLEMPVLLGVMQQMKPARSAPILAEMDVIKSKDVTLQLSKQHELPNAKVAKP
jgi:flagellar motility protein MotE (MotC chaperone)